MDNKYIINKVLNKENLTKDEAYEVMDSIMKGSLSESYVSGLLVALRCKGDTVEEITSFAKAMKDNAVSLVGEEDSLDIVGTGGDYANTFNISSISSIVIASSGIKVTKHGNRSVSSRCGSADVFEGLGININLNREQDKLVLKNANIAFLYAQNYHKSMKYVSNVRKELASRTIFNILGPLTNPASSKYAVIGVYDKLLCNIFAKVLANLGVKKAYIVHSEDGLDEVSLSSRTYVTKLEDGSISEFIFNPKDYGFTLCKNQDLKGGDVSDNIQIAKDILEGRLTGPKKDCVVINSGFGISLAKNLPLEDSFKMARELIETGKALEKLNEYRGYSNDFR